MKTVQALIGHLFAALEHGYQANPMAHQFGGGL